MTNTDDPLVLFVDDDADLRKQVRTETLALTGREWLTASNVRLTLEVMKEHSREYMTVILDWQLQGASENGIELLRRIKAEASDWIVAYIWTDYLTAEIVRVAVDAGAYAAFNKAMYTLPHLIPYTTRQSAAMQHLMASTADFLTGLSNIRDFEKKVVRDLSGSMLEVSVHPDKRRHADSFNMLCVDLDYFKAVNDTHGHPVGTRTIIAVAKAIEKSIRDTDRACRLGGDEFLVLVPGDEEAAERVTANLRRKVEEAEVLDEKGEKIQLRVPLSVSVGSSRILREEISNPVEDFRRLFSMADKAMYDIKDAR